MDELFALYEEAAGAAAGVIDAGIPTRFEHLDQEFNHALRGVEIASSSTLRRCEPLEEILIDLTEPILALVFLSTDPDVREQVDDLAEPDLVERRPGVVTRKHAP